MTDEAAVTRPRKAEPDDPFEAVEEALEDAVESALAAQVEESLERGRWLQQALGSERVHFGIVLLLIGLVVLVLLILQSAEPINSAGLP